MPASYQGTMLAGRRARRSSTSSLPRGHDVARCSATCSTSSARGQRRASGRSRADNADLAARIASYELAFKMQQHAPEAVDLAQETAETQELYGIDERAHGRLRPPLPAGPPTGRARRALRADLRRRQPQRRQLGRPRRPGQEPHLPRRPHRQADRRLARGPQAARAARRNADRLGRRVRPPADRRIRQGHRPRSQRLWLHDVDGRRRHQGRRQRRRDRRTGRGGRRPIRSTSSICTPRS